jgi:hypothetical protein
MAYEHPSLWRNTRETLPAVGRRLSDKRATSGGIAGASSQAEALQTQGFTRWKAAPFQLFGSREIDQVLAYEKQAAAGECYRFGKWVVVLGFEDARSARNRSRAADGKASRSSMQSKMEQPGFSTNIRIVGQNPRTAAYS